MRSDDIRVAGRMNHHVPPPGPPGSRVLEHRQHEEVFEPHRAELGPPLNRVGRTWPKYARPLGDLQVAPEVLWPRNLRLRPLLVLRVDSDDTERPVATLEDEYRVERPQAVEIRRVQPSRRVGETDVADGARRVGPPGVDGPVGEREVDSQIAEEVEGQRRGPQEVGPQSLVIEGLVTFDHGRPGPCCLERARRDEGRT